MTTAPRPAPDPEAWHLALEVWRAAGHSRPLRRVYSYIRRQGHRRRQQLWRIVT